ncbi:MAG: DNA-processing protein DprA [Lachnospiraceae bacterium]|nr:DNA-processing protein DprA [Lachnospiraceae bacterium]
MNTNSENSFIRRLCLNPNLNGRLGIKLIEHFGNARKVFEADPEEFTGILPRKQYDKLMNIQDFAESNDEPPSFISIYDPGYPERLKKISDPPLGLWYYGKLPEEDIPSAAVIGARDCSDYGRYIAASLGEYLGRSGVQVISGLARGIDGIAQKAALDAGGTSCGVLGCGADICYPPSNRPVYDKLKENGCIISSYPPGYPAIASNFPPRNRIVSGLSDAVVVIEARQKSGTLITVDMALEQGREVFAVPGRITDRLSDGCNGLIGQGANVFLSPEIFLCELNQVFEKKKENPQDGNLQAESPVRIKSGLKNSENKTRHREFCGKDSSVSELSESERKVLDKLSLTPVRCEELLLKLKDLDYTELSMILMQLLIGGFVKQVSQGFFVRIYK